MKLLCVHYGVHSVAISYVARSLGTRGDVQAFDPLDGFLYRKIYRLRFPTLALEPIKLLAAAWRQHRSSWLAHYPFTVGMFDALTERTERFINQVRPDRILQFGSLFSPGRSPLVPYFLYLDHTRAIAERYEPIPGLPRPLRFDPRWRVREDGVYDRAEVIFTHSNHVRQSLVDDYRIEPQRVYTVGAGPNVIPHQPVEQYRREKAFLFVGIDFLRKGGPVLFKAFAQVRERHPDAQLWVAGGFRTTRRHPGVRYIGRLDPIQLEEWYRRAFAFVLPTLREPFGVAFLEAMAFALPCVGTKIEAVPEIIIDGETGWLVPPNDERALAEAMVRLLDKPEVASEMGRAGRERVMSSFGWERSAGRMLSIMLRDAVRLVT